MSREASRWYDAHAGSVVPSYEAIDAARLHAWFADVLPSSSALILDVGAGSGRDAAWLASLGHEVVAVEPSAAMRREAMQRHPEPRIRWIDDALPGLEATLRLGLAFDLILLSAVWMHVALAERARAFRKLVTLLKPGGRLAITLRHGPAETARAMHAVSAGEIEQLARSHGALVEQTMSAADAGGHDEIRWTQILLRLPDDGTGALPLLRSIILSDAKSSTYKLGLLRATARSADSAAGMARDVDDELVALPLGLIGLFWIRLYKPLLQADLPQSPSNRRLEGLGFTGPGFRAIQSLTAQDLRPGARFAGSTAGDLHAALREACKTIASMPARYITYANDEPILVARPARGQLQPSALVLDEVYLASFGELIIPRSLWRALVRFDAWIEPALVAEWIRLMKAYAAGQGRGSLEEGVMARAMTWSDPARDVELVRRRTLQLLEQGSPLVCVWSGKALAPASLDIDHCLPWSAWPCDDLWNLLPADRRINQHQKRERLPSAARLLEAQDAIQAWWSLGYVGDSGSSLRERFFIEAHSSLPKPTSDQPDLESIFTGVTLTRLRLGQDQQLFEW